MTGVILAKNEAAHIGDCIDSLRPWVGRTSSCGIRAAPTTRATSHARTARWWHAGRSTTTPRSARPRSTALDAQWILFVDADERMTETVGRKSSQPLAWRMRGRAWPGCWLPRRNFIAGREVRGGGFYPDYQLRLLRRGKAQYAPEREVHEIVEVDGDEAFAAQPLLHYNYRDWRQFHRKQPVYARYEARILAARGVHARPHNFVLQPLREFRRRFVTLRGYVDGLHGLQLALWLAWYYGALPYWYLLVDAELRRGK